MKMMAPPKPFIPKKPKIDLKDLPPINLSPINNPITLVISFLLLNNNSQAWFRICKVFICKALFFCMFSVKAWEALCRWFFLFKKARRPRDHWGCSSQRYWSVLFLIPFEGYFASLLTGEIYNRVYNSIVYICLFLVGLSQEVHPLSHNRTINIIHLQVLKYVCLCVYIDVYILLYY